MYNKIDLREVPAERLKEISLDLVDIDVKAPEFEPNRQFYFMAKARDYVKRKSAELGRPMTFFTQTFGCPIDEKSQEIIDRIINSEGGKAVIHYIAVYRKKTGDDVKEEKIETQYREFLKELIYCWADGRCTFG